MKRPGLAVAVVLDVVLVIGLVQGWLPAGSAGMRGFLIVFTCATAGLVLASVLSNGRDSRD